MTTGTDSAAARATGRAALRGLVDDLRACAIDADLTKAQAQTPMDRAVAGLVAGLDRWDAAADACDRRLAERVAASLDVTERRRLIEFASLLSAAEAPEGGSTPCSSPARARRGSRTAALLVSAGVACLGLSTLAVVLEPPFPAPALSGAPGARAEIVLRGPILVAPPRSAPADEVMPPVAAPPPPSSVDKRLAAAISDAEQGRPGAIIRLRDFAEAGLPRAQMYLAKLYETGRSVDADSAEARRWTARAADAGDAIAMHNLALYYLEGRGGPRDDAAAARLLKRSAVAGVADSQFNLGLLYETGVGVERNLVEAYRWFQVAAHAGDLTARSRAVALEARLSPREMVSAERSAAGFRPGTVGAEEAWLVAGAATVAESQKKLARLGLYIGPTDGQDTPAYRRAVEAYRDSQRTQSAAFGGPADD